MSDSSKDVAVEPASAEANASTAHRTTGDLVKAAVSGWLGTALEFMDFQLYSLAAALVFKDLFFPAGDQATAILGAMAIYGVGYIARPLGAWYFGRLGDRIGRTKILYITIALMGVATTLIGFLPTYQQVGLLAPLLLVVLRLAQGFGAGAEISGASVMLAEYAPEGRRGLISSLVALGTNSGTLGAGLIWAILLGVVGTDGVIAWAWRIPFIGSIVLLGLALFVRAHLKESPVFVKVQQAGMEEVLSDEELLEEYDKPLPSKKERRAQLKADKKREREEAKRVAASERMKVKRSWKAFLAACLLRFGQSGNSGMVQTFLITFLTAYWLVSKDVASNVVVYSSLVGFITVPIIGIIGDKIGRERTYTIITGIGLLLIIPCFLAMMNNRGVADTPELVDGVSIPHFGNPDLMFFVGYIVLHNVTVLALFSLENISMAECFGSAHRYEQLALSKEIPNLITAGFGPLIAAWLVQLFNGSWIACAVLMFFYTGVVFVTSIIMPDVTDRDLTIKEDAF
ncbi:MFS transporter, MHS family, metabolite:H+ symporter [Actinobaculum suis]|uniref:MFS transporter n=1 Tax=Actinobaculum suis TaxID=1657 RepID=A0A1G7CXB4_9ACTO|nr:MFS transporter [Actinobaculum suis]MDY5152771.1 MFS transporter [Actinobaculum suis]SDE44094.1 MFS transporter, MHS family, metabolite:H+ symporter [Actinobaculum suis]